MYCCCEICERNESLLRIDMPPEDHDGTVMVEVPWMGLSPQQPTPRHPCTLGITFKTTMGKKYGFGYVFNAKIGRYVSSYLHE